MARRILIDGKWTRVQRVSGVQRYAEGLVGALARTGAPHELLAPAAGGWRANLWEQLRLPRQTRSGDVLFCPANMAPLRLPSGVRSVVTLHCLRFLEHPENYSAAFRTWYGFAIPRVLRRASAVLTVSRTMADALVERFPQARAKTHVVHPGLDAAFQPEGEARTPAGADAPTWLFAGNALPAKNLATVARAARASRSGARILAAGVERAELERLQLGEAASAVIPLGYVHGASALAALARGATGVVAPSLYESFDLPLAEGLACGKPVLASDLPVHREVAGEAARYVEAEDVEAWAHALDRWAAPSPERDELQRLARERAALYSWERAAAQVRALLDAVAEGREPAATASPSAPETAPAVGA